MTKSVRALLVASGVLASVSVAAGDPPTAEAPPVEVPGPVPVEEDLSARFLTTVRGRAEATFSANLDDSRGDVSVYRLGTGIGLSGPINQRLRLSVNVDSEFSWYDFNNVTELIAGTDDPISEAYRLNLAPQLVYIQSERLSYFAGAILESAGTYDADFGETISGGGFGGVRYRINDDLALSFGLGAKSRLEDDTLVLPLIGVEWTLSDRVTITSEGLGATLAAKLSEDWWFTATAAWELRDYRLDKDGPLPGGVLTDERVPVGIGFAWRPSRGVSVELIGGAVVWQEYSSHDSDGDKLSELNTDPAGFIRLSGRITF